MSDRMRVAIVGAGIGAKHFDGYLANPEGFEVVVVCDLNMALAGQLAARAEAEVSPSFSDILARPDIDIIDICLPPYLHFDAVMRSLAAGKHVICEKPFVASLEQVEQIREAAKLAGRQVMPVFQYRYGNGLARMRHLQSQNLAGQPSAAAAETHWNRDATYYNVTWRGYKKTELGGAMLGHAIHTHDLLTYVLGPVRRVFAAVAVKVNNVETDDVAAICMEMASGALVTSSVTLGSAPEEITRLRFCFDNLTIENDGVLPYQPAEGTWRFMPRGDRTQEEIEQALLSFNPHKESFAGQFEALHEAFLSNSAWPVTLDDAERALELVTAIYKSSATRQQVELPLAPDDALRAGWASVLP